MQLFKRAEDGIGWFLPLPKKNPSSASAEATASLPWTALLVPSTPNRALIDLGASFWAVWVLVGPISYLHFVTAPSAVSSIPMTFPLVMKF